MNIMSIRKRISDTVVVNDVTCRFSNLDAFCLVLGVGVFLSADGVSFSKRIYKTKRSKFVSARLAFF